MFLLSLCDPRVSSWQIHVYSAHYMHIHVSRKRSVKSTTGYTDCCACKFKNIVSLKILKLFTDVRFVCFQVWTPMTGIQCQICHMMFTDQAAINAHYDTAHATTADHPEAIHECEVCGRKFVHKSDLKRHLSTVHGVGGVKSFQCNVCLYP